MSRVKQFVATKYNVFKNNWYKFEIVLNPTTSYKKGTMNIYGGSEKRLLFPKIKLPDICLSKVNKVTNVEELDKITDFTVCFKTDEFINVSVSTTNLSIKSIKLVRLTETELRKEIDVWRLRRLYNLEYLNYYIEKMYPYTGGKLNHHFIDRFNAEYRLFQNNTILDKFISELKIEKTLKPNENETKVLFLVSSSYQYEQTGYTTRTQKLAQFGNNNDHNYKIIVCTKYSYPYEMDKSYYTDKQNNNEIDGVNYYHIGTSEHHLNSMNLLDYLKKYIEEIVNFCIEYNIKIIQASSNYLNGIVAIYVGRYLGLKTIYDVRDFWDETSYLLRPEIYRSDLLKLRSNMETFVLRRIDYILTVDNNMKDEILNKGVDEYKIVVLSDAVDTDIYKHDDTESNNRKIKYGLLKSEIILGTDCDDLEKITIMIHSIQKMKPVICSMMYFGKPSLKIQQKIKSLQFESHFIVTEESKDIDVCDVVFFKETSNINKSVSYGKLILSNISDFLFINFNNVDELVQILDNYKNNHYKNVYEKNREYAINNLSFESVGDRLIKFILTRIL